MTSTSAAGNIKKTLHQDLAKIGRFSECVLLNYPNSCNVGDHLIWLGEVFYLTDICGTKIKYTAAELSDFSAKEMEKQAGKSPIIFHGGGNLGDLWGVHQEFREYIISQYCDRPIVIMPQSIYFASAENLKQAAKIFNFHPDLTLFVREQRSYEIALKHFVNCQIFKAPDIAFQLADTPYLNSYNIEPESSILYHCRYDAELNQSFSDAPIFTLPNLLAYDWISLHLDYWYLRELMLNNLQLSPNAMQISPVSMQIRGANFMEWILRQLQQTFDAHAVKLDSLYNPKMHRTSLGMMHCGIYQFKPHRMVITNRLHGHILCVLLDIPHIFLANSYYKNESFYENWTHQVPFCRFVKNSSDILPVAQELMENYCQS
ncbi:MAG: polysaccharide pyruvyl transferase family protein [Nostoc sp.]|uniref:polysaccharide pyruvyl transferase family protein n=1 Tax=Nostoc sp. TaxID=1180 RepID=UPI002FF1FE5D